MDEARCTRAGVMHGGRLALPFKVSSILHGVLFGVVCKEAELRVAEAVLMSTLVASGSAQFAAMEIWTVPVATGAMTLVVLLVNLRFVVIASTLPSWFARLPTGGRYGTAFFVTDESWAISMREFHTGSRDAGILIGSGATVYAGWILGTGLGFVVAPGGLGDLPGLVFLVPALLIAVLWSFWGGPRSSLAPWIAAAVVATVIARWFPGSWHVVAGGAVGALVGAWFENA